MFTFLIGFNDKQIYELKTCSLTKTDDKLTVPMKMRTTFDTSKFVRLLLTNWWLKATLGNTTKHQQPQQLQLQEQQQSSTPNLSSSASPSDRILKNMAEAEAALVIALVKIGRLDCAQQLMQQKRRHHKSYSSSA